VGAKNFTTTSHVQSTGSKGEQPKQSSAPRRARRKCGQTAERCPRVVQTRNQTRNVKGSTPLTQRHGSKARERKALLHTDSRSRRRPTVNHVAIGLCTTMETYFALAEIPRCHFGNHNSIRQLSAHKGSAWASTRSLVGESFATLRENKCQGALCRLRASSYLAGVPPVPQGTDLGPCNTRVKVAWRFLYKFGRSSMCAYTKRTFIQGKSIV